VITKAQVWKYIMYRGCILNCQKHHMCNCQKKLQIGTSLEEYVPTFSNEFLQVEN
jgi:hypothetical protein